MVAQLSFFSDWRSNAQMLESPRLPMNAVELETLTLLGPISRSLRPFFVAKPSMVRNGFPGPSRTKTLPVFPAGTQTCDPAAAR